MKKLIRGGVALLALMGGYAMADTTGNVSLGGTVTSTLAITATDTAGATALSLGGGAIEQIVKVADVAMLTNNEQGLTLTAVPTDMTKTGGSTITFVVATLPDNEAIPAAAHANWSQPYGNLGSGDLLGDLWIKYTPAPLQDPGTYSGSISLSVSDNL